jgi:hypothetical protein
MSRACILRVCNEQNPKTTSCGLSCDQVAAVPDNLLRGLLAKQGSRVFYFESPRDSDRVIRSDQRRGIGRPRQLRSNNSLLSIAPIRYSRRPVHRIRISASSTGDPLADGQPRQHAYRHTPKWANRICTEQNGCLCARSDHCKSVPSRCLEPQ